jgi:hypothetical protein
MARQAETDNPTLRIVLYKGEVARLPRTHRGLAVREGVAWMTRDGKDAVLRAGDWMDAERSKWATVVSALEGPLVIELTGAAHPRSPAIIRARHQQIAGGAA